MDTDFKLKGFHTQLIPQPDNGKNDSPLQGCLLAQFYHMRIILLHLLHEKRNQFLVKLQDNHLLLQKPVDFLLPEHIFLIGEIALPGFKLKQVVQGAVQHLRNAA